MPQRIPISQEGLVRRAAWYMSRPREQGYSEDVIRAEIEQVRPDLPRSQITRIIETARRGRELRSYFETQIRRFQREEGLPIGAHGYLGNEDWGGYRPGRYHGQLRTESGGTIGIEIHIFGELPDGSMTDWTEKYNVGPNTTLEEIRQWAMRPKKYPRRGGRGGGWTEVTPTEVLFRGSAWVPFGDPTHTFE